MPEFNEWVDAPNGTAPPDAGVFEPPGNTRDEQVGFCLRNRLDPVFGERCNAWLLKAGIRK